MGMTVMAGEESGEVGCVLWCCCWYVVNDNLRDTAYYPSIK